MMMMMMVVMVMVMVIVNSLGSDLCVTCSPSYFQSSQITRQAIRDERHRRNQCMYSFISSNFNNNHAERLYS